MYLVESLEKCFTLICAACDRSVELQAFQMSYILATLLRVFRRTTSYVAIISLSKPSPRVLRSVAAHCFHDDEEAPVNASTWRTSRPSSRDGTQVNSVNAFSRAGNPAEQKYSMNCLQR